MKPTLDPTFNGVRSAVDLLLSFIDREALAEKAAQPALILLDLLREENGKVNPVLTGQDGTTFNGEEVVSVVLFSKDENGVTRPRLVTMTMRMDREQDGPDGYPLVHGVMLRDVSIDEMLNEVVAQIPWDKLPVIAAAGIAGYELTEDELAEMTTTDTDELDDQRRDAMRELQAQLLDEGTNGPVTDEPSGHLLPPANAPLNDH